MPYVTGQEMRSWDISEDGGIEVFVDLTVGVDASPRLSPTLLAMDSSGTKAILGPDVEEEWRLPFEIDRAPITRRHD